MLTQEQIQSYDQDGFFVVKQLISLEKCAKLKSIVHRLIDEWEPETDYSWIFPNGAKTGRSKDQYLMDSCDKVSFFMDKGAVNPDTGKLNHEKHQSVSRIGHALHKYEPEFKDVVFSDKIKAILHDLKFLKPVLRQSLYIFKQPLIGEPVTIHRDSIYIHVDPSNIVAVWIALEDATVENGCLWFIPGSHSKTPQQRYIRNPNEKEFNEGKKLIMTGEAEKFDDNAFIPVEVKAGDAVIIHGQVVHKSEQNKSPVSRQSFILHFFETHNVVYSKENWFQSTAPFPLVYDE